MTKKEFFESLVGKTVEYYFGGFNPLLMNVSKVNETPWNWTDEDGVEHTSITYSISENGWSFYAVTVNNVKVIGEVDYGI